MSYARVRERVLTVMGLEGHEVMDYIDGLRLIAGEAKNKQCYQCGAATSWLAPDSRCGGCTRFTPSEVRGDE